MSETTEEYEYLFSEERRLKASKILEKANTVLNKMRDEGPSLENEVFAKGVAYGVSIAIGAVAISIEETRVNETTEDVVNDLLLAFSRALMMVSA